ncbi:MAG: carbohydrate binding domain-containing protein, partial [Fibrobacter sp.]|nr:carbohydrate binding domain-containing protein [Fibrobacter sp.]
MNKKSYLVLMAVLLTIFSTSSAFSKITFKPLKKEKVVETGPTQDPRLVYRFFDEDYISGGYAYWYPDNSKVFIPEESGKNGEVALQFDLDANDYSGGSVCLYNLLYDMSDIFSTGALQFWVKGATGGEIAWVALVDEENTDGKKAVVRLPLQNYGGIKSEWTQIQVPLVDFGNRGVFWDEKKKVEVPEKFNWKGVGEFRIEIKKADNPSFKVWVDDVFVLRDVFEAKEVKDEIYWDEVETEVTALDITKRPKVNDVFTMFDNGVASGGFTYVYGGKTASSVINAGSKNQVLACYLDNRD